jgi:dTDP-4-amino-4,6-dideoxygalactose transaminase
MCPQALQEAINWCEAQGKKPKAILPVHLYGMPANMAELMAIANRHEIPVVEDAAEALGSTYQGQACGTFGQMGVLSFNGNKIITTSGGGALVAQAAEAEQARFLSTQARDSAPHYQHSHIGYNYRMSNVSAGIGRGQMEVLRDRVAQRRAHHDAYETALSQLPGISFLKEPEGSFSNRWLTTILVDESRTNAVDREKIRLSLDELNIESRPLWKPMHLQPIFQACPFFGGEVAAQLFRQGLCLPSGSNMAEADRTLIIDTIFGLF